METKEIRELYSKVLTNIRTVMIGSEEVFSLIFSAMLANGHVLLEDMPGTGKTTMAKCIADSIDVSFKRVQFTPDLMPQDITGLNIYSQKSEEFEFIPGPVFTNILLADEINRATPRTQSALLEAMEERVVTVDGDSRKLDAPFIVIATENPIETTGTFPLPEAQLDRFMVKLTMGDLSTEQESEILARFIKDSPQNEVKPVCTAEDMINASEAIKDVIVKKELMDYIVSLSESTRISGKLFLINCAKYVFGTEFSCAISCKVAFAYVESYELNIRISGSNLIDSFCKSISGHYDNVETFFDGFLD